MVDVNVSAEAAAATAGARREMAAVGAIVDALEPYEIETRTQILAAVMCLHSIECAKAAIAVFMGGGR